jgi:MraZ protein
MFRGPIPVSLDGKGRLAIPTKFRDPLTQRGGGTLVVTLHSRRCLMLYGLADWEPIEEAINKLPSFHPLAQDLQDMLVGNASEVEMDGTGRILLPVMHRNYAKLDKDVVLVGKGTRFDIWNAGAWDARMDGMGDLTGKLDEAQRNGDLPDALRNFRL